KVTINFIMKLEDGTIIEDTYKSGIPMTFVLGNRDAIEGLEEGVATMRVGGRRKLIVPPELGFGTHSYRGIPPNSKLIIEVELMKIE
ncbi:MAG: FKBP-type peptidyl-prolyl cis-trans isomerase, partial [Candidatus Kapaibacteriota bacterium]